MAIPGAEGKKHQVSARQERWRERHDAFADPLLAGDLAFQPVNC